MDPIYYEVGCCATFHGQVVTLMMGEDEDRSVIGRFISRSTLPVEIPIATAGGEHVTRCANRTVLYAAEV